MYETMEDVLVCDRDGCNKEAFRIVLKNRQSRGKIEWLCIEHKVALEE